MLPALLPINDIGAGPPPPPAAAAIPPDVPPRAPLSSPSTQRSVCSTSLSIDLWGRGEMVKNDRNYKTNNFNNCNNKNNLNDNDILVINI